MTNDRGRAPSLGNNARRLALRRDQESRWPPLFHGAFRPFFLASALWFPTALLWWVASLAGHVAVQSPLGPVGWHRHELLFGGAGAAIAGYALTATPNWTGGLPANGGRLLAMLMWWGIARVANFIPPLLGPIVPAIIEVGFFVALAAACGREARQGKQRGAAFVAFLPLVAIVCAASHVAASAAELPLRAVTHCAVALIIMLISITAGRLVPSFTRNALPPTQIGALTAQQNWFDALVQVVTASALLIWLFEAVTTERIGLIAAATVQAVRMVRWGGWRVRADPAVLALHIAYAWVPLGLAALALAPLLQQSAALHAITAGAIPAIILAVMARVSITQTGQAPWLRAAPLISVVLVSIGAAVRVASGVLGAAVQLAHVIAATALVLGFVTFLIVFTAPLFSRRETVRRRAKPN